MSDGHEEKEEKHPKLVTYTNEGFEEFLQQTELAGISRERQDELIIIFLAQDIPLETLILHALSKLWVSIRGFVSRHTVLVVVLAMMLGGVGFVGYQEYQARSGKILYQPWQFKMAATFKHYQIKLLKPLFDWDIIFNMECVIVNPVLAIHALMRGVKGVDCEEMPRRLIVAKADEYGEDDEYDGDEFPLPFVLQDSLEGWKLNEMSTLHDFHEIITSDGLKSYPCVMYGSGQSVDNTPDPLSELMAGDLRDEQGTKIEAILLSGCSSHSKRALRSVSRSQRPVFLDTHVELLEELRAITAGDIAPGNTVEFTIKAVEEKERGKEVYLVQVFGESSVVLQDLDCLENPPLVRTLVAGDVLVVGPEDSLQVRLTGAGEKLMMYQSYSISEDDDKEGY